MHLVSTVLVPGGRVLDSTEILDWNSRFQTFRPATVEMALVVHEDRYLRKRAVSWSSDILDPAIRNDPGPVSRVRGRDVDGRRSEFLKMKVGECQSSPDS